MSLSLITLYIFWNSLLHLRCFNFTYTLPTPISDISAELQIHKTSCLAICYTLSSGWLSYRPSTTWPKTNLLSLIRLPFLLIFLILICGIASYSVSQARIGNHANMFYKNPIQVSQTDDQDSYQIRGTII